MGYLCTCARAHRASVSQERPDRLCSNLVCGLEVSAFHKSWVGWGISARAHVHPHLRIPGSEWPIVLKFDVWLLARDPIVTRFTRVEGGVTTFARACPVSLWRTPLRWWQCEKDHRCVGSPTPGSASLLECGPILFGGTIHVAEQVLTPHRPLGNGALYFQHRLYVRPCKLNSHRQL